MDSLLPKSKVCNVGKGKVLGCGKEKLLEEFYKHPRGKYGRFSQCKACVAEYHKDNKEKKAKYDKQHYQDNKEKRVEQDKQYRKDNPEKIAEWEKKYKEKRQIIHNFKRRNDEQYRIRGDISNALCFELRNVGKTKTASILTYIGCTIEFMQEHLNSTIKPEWGDCDLHKDHIIPRSLFDHTNEEEVKKCWNWRNLRYLPAKENRSKGNTLDMGLVKSYGIEDLLPQKKEIEHE